MQIADAGESRKAGVIKLEGTFGLYVRLSAASLGTSWEQPNQPSRPSSRPRSLPPPPALPRSYVPFHTFCHIRIPPSPISFFPLYTSLAPPYPAAPGSLHGARIPVRIILASGTQQDRRVFYGPSCPARPRDRFVSSRKVPNAPRGRTSWYRRTYAVFASANRCSRTLVSHPAFLLGHPPLPPNDGWTRR